jgi:hypothetical protein
MPHSRAKIAEVAERRAKLVAYRRQRRPYDEIYQELGYGSPAAARKDFMRAVEESIAAQHANVEVYREEQLLELDYLAREAHQVLTGEHYVVSASGKVACDPHTEQPLIDYAPKLAAIDRLVKILDRVAKLRGLDQIKVQVLTIDAIDAEIQRLHGELAALGDEAGEAAGAETATG